ncbi:DEKNAAC100866 [Brettanomyces naardenensis]|uniref:DEKNAAC100866 n=1 Tax=Brettanomyces naardenensis TaxID=13370 RepID=A0A448YGK2_BRENA|nr:DEKNAAC100866 [Brettanomyces naardenensis]
MPMSIPLLAAKTLTLHWHDNSGPVYSVDFQPRVDGQRSARLATGGGDFNVRIWRLVYGKEDGQVESVEYLSTLPKHTQAVNCVRFNPTGEYLASAADDGTVLIWALSDTIIREFGSEDEDIKESWFLKTSCFTALSEVYDICWSPDSRYICCGSMDNIVRIFNVSTGIKVREIAQHSHYVQGVAWDPRNEYICSQSADRSVNIYKILSEPGTELKVSPTAFYKIYRAELPTARIQEREKDVKDESPVASPVPATPMLAVPTSSPIPMSPPTQTPRHKRTYSNSSTSSSHSTNRCPSPLALPAVMPAPYKTVHLFHNEMLPSFFRRLAFSPDGSLLLTVSGIYKIPNSASDPINTVYIHTRLGLNRPPVAHLPGFKKPAIAVRFSPVIYKLIPGTRSCFSLPYRMVFAVATQDSVVVFDTQHLKPLGIAANIHYNVITDICWSADGRVLLASSTDTFVSSMILSDELLGSEVESYDAPDFVKTHPLKRPQSTAPSPKITDSKLAKPSTVKETPSITEMLQSSSSASTALSLGVPNDSSRIRLIDTTDIEEEDEVVFVRESKGDKLESRSEDKSEGKSGEKSAEKSMDKSEENKRRRIQPTLVSSGHIH